MNEIRIELERQIHELVTMMVTELVLGTSHLKYRSRWLDYYYYHSLTQENFAGLTWEIFDLETEYSSWLG